MEIIEKVRTEDTTGFEWKLDDCWESAKMTVRVHFAHSPSQVDLCCSNSHWLVIRKASPRCLGRWSLPGNRRLSKIHPLLKTPLVIITCSQTGRKNVFLGTAEGDHWLNETLSNRETCFAWFFIGFREIKKKYQWEKRGSPAHSLLGVKPTTWTCTLSQNQTETSGYMGQRTTFNPWATPVRPEQFLKF